MFESVVSADVSPPMCGCVIWSRDEGTGTGHKRMLLLDEAKYCHGERQQIQQKNTNKTGTNALRLVNLSPQWQYRAFLCWLCVQLTCVVGFAELEITTHCTKQQEKYSSLKIYYVEYFLLAAPGIFYATLKALGGAAVGAGELMRATLQHSKEGFTIAR